jgi:hypothetical protein
LSSAWRKDCEKTDEIRTFCNVAIPLLSPCDKIFARVCVKFCIDIARSADICTGKNNFQNLPRKWCARTGIEQKMSESPPSDSRRTQLPAEIFYAITRADLILHRNFSFTRAQARRAIAALHPKRTPAREHGARVRVRVSSSGFR